MIHHHFDLISIFAGMPVISILTYAARKFPMPQNVYGRWALGVVQFALGNKDLSDQNFQAQSPDTKQGGGVYSSLPSQSNKE